MIVDNNLNLLENFTQGNYLENKIFKRIFIFLGTYLLEFTKVRRVTKSAKKYQSFVVCCNENNIKSL